MPDNESLPSPLPANLSKAEHITLFAPSNQAIEAAFDDVEKWYLEGEFGLEGVARVVGSGVVVALGKEGVGWRDHWSKGSENGKAYWAHSAHIMADISSWSCSW